MKKRLWQVSTFLLVLCLLVICALPANAGSGGLPILLFLSTGRRFSPETPATEAAPSPPPATEETQPAETTEETVSLPVFSPDDAACIAYNGARPYTVDTLSLLQKPLSWDLHGEAPTVLIYHTHTTEAYAGVKGYRSRDPALNMVHIGDVLAENLEKEGIHCLHAPEIHDNPEYNGAYGRSRKTAKAYMKKSEDIRIVLDLHRDSVVDKGKEMAFTCGDYAKIMLVVGTDANGLTHKNWQENMALALKLRVVLERLCPGVCRQVNFRKERFNQDLSPGALLIEVGAAGNTLRQAENSAKLLAEAISLLSRGTE